VADVLMIVWGTKGYAGGMSTQIVSEEQCLYVQKVLKEKCQVECVGLEPPLGGKAPKKGITV
jgi:hypothetical protein